LQAGAPSSCGIQIRAGRPHPAAGLFCHAHPTYRGGLTVPSDPHPGTSRSRGSAGGRWTDRSARSTTGSGTGSRMQRGPDRSLASGPRPRFRRCVPLGSARLQAAINSAPVDRVNDRDRTPRSIAFLGLRRKPEESVADAVSYILHILLTTSFSPTLPPCPSSSGHHDSLRGISGVSLERCC
jgi:hypothetical protein